MCRCKNTSAADALNTEWERGIPSAPRLIYQNIEYHCFKIPPEIVLKYISKPVEGFAQGKPIFSKGEKKMTKQFFFWFGLKSLLL